MQKVEGSNPFSRFEKGLQMQPFLLAQSAYASASGRTDSGLAPGRSSAVSTKPPCLQAHSGSSEPKSFCRLVKVGCSPAAAITPTRTAGTIQRTAPAGAIPTVAVPGGQSGFSPETRGEPPPAPRQPQASHGTQSRELLRRAASDAAARSHNRDLVSRESHGGHHRGSLSIGNQ